MNNGSNATDELPRGWEYAPPGLLEGVEPWPGLPDGLRERILIAIGQASVCWAADGVFDTEQAIEVARNLAWEIDQAYSEKEQA